MSHDVLDRAPDDRLQALDSDGEIVDPDLVPDIGDEALVSMYRDMRFARRFDERMISLQRQGRLGTYSSLAGQEGSQIGSTYALADEDTIFYQYREHGALVARGLPWEYVLYWMGHEAGNAAIGDVNVFPLNISIGAHIPHAVGWSWAAKRKSDERAGVVHFGDGAMISLHAALSAKEGGIRVGDRGTIGTGCVLHSFGGIEIGDDTMVAALCHIGGGRYDYQGDPTVPMHEQPLPGRGVTIEEDCWIGAGANVLDGVTVGAGSVVAAGAVVVDDVPPGSIVGGVPAKEIGERFPESRERDDFG
jgi:acetyltransferase-like isoleucine patch superfamily enzyme